jgi:origin recognition complex subunit 5
MAFPLDRMIAILGVLLEENDVDTRPPNPDYNIPGEYTELEISRVAVFSQVSSSCRRTA